MFDEFAFRDFLRRKNVKITKIAEILNISTPTLYRKMTGTSDFYRSEIQKICDYFNEEDLNYIFFAKQVS